MQVFGFHGPIRLKAELPKDLKEALNVLEEQEHVDTEFDCSDNANSF